MEELICLMSYFDRMSFRRIDIESHVICSLASIGWTEVTCLASIGWTEVTWLTWIQVAVAEELWDGGTVATAVVTTLPAEDTVHRGRSFTLRSREKADQRTIICNRIIYILVSATELFIYSAGYKLTNGWGFDLSPWSSGSRSTPSGKVLKWGWGSVWSNTLERSAVYC